MKGKHRLLVMAHGHPDFSLGGAEMASYQFFKAAQSHPDVASATFLAAHGHTASGAIRLRRPDEYLWEQTTHGSFQFQGANRYATLTALRSLVEHVRPTVVFMHHYMALGLECIRVIRDVDRDIRIVVTLHELLAICNNNGQMVKTESLRLCERESPEECHRCFPHASPESFWLRKQYIDNYFGLVDHFVTPSAFLRERYVTWGLAPDRITVIENGQAVPDALPPRPVRPDQPRGHFAFFGQINPYKGVDVLLEAASLIPADDRGGLRIDIHGANLEQQSPDFRERIDALRAPLEAAGIVRWVGPYTRAELPKRMQHTDWLVVPSIWWENSPMVIQEAFALGRPVLCSDIGGMAEKVTHGVDGWHVQARNAYDWAETMVRVMHEPGLWKRLSEGIRPPLSYAACVTEHLKLC